MKISLRRFVSPRLLRSLTCGYEEIPVSNNGILHITAVTSGLVSDIVGIPKSHILHCISLGAVYVKHSYSHKDGKAKRLIEDIIVYKDDYIRVHLHPRRFSVSSIDWNSRVLDESDEHIVINKPAGIPCLPILDNSKENVMECVRLLKCKESQLFPPHRLDEDTEGVLLFAKNKIKAAEYSELFKNKMLTKR